MTNPATNEFNSPGYTPASDSAIDEDATVDVLTNVKDHIAMARAALSESVPAAGEVVEQKTVVAKELISEEEVLIARGESASLELKFKSSPEDVTAPKTYPAHDALRNPSSQKVKIKQPSSDIEPDHSASQVGEEHETDFGAMFDSLQSTNLRVEQMEEFGSNLGGRVADLERAVADLKEQLVKVSVGARSGLAVARSTSAGSPVIASSPASTTSPSTTTRSYADTWRTATNARLAQAFLITPSTKESRAALQEIYNRVINQAGFKVLDRKTELGFGVAGMERLSRDKREAIIARYLSTEPPV